MFYNFYKLLLANVLFDEIILFDRGVGGVQTNLKRQ